ncbi:MAG: phage replication initiation protein [Lachnospiraceae bacterium]|nr:phage replication initiation protein [Lachnospiraceae bacterium]
MSSKRMFTAKITDSDPFTDMPLSAQGLYFQFCMNADDDGFVNKVKKVMGNVGASKKDYQYLVDKRFILVIDGVVIIKHWRMHNTISRNRYHETQYTDIKAKLLLKDNGAYSLTEGSPIDDSKLIERETACEQRADGVQPAHTEGKPKKATAKKAAEPVVYYPNDIVLDGAFKSYVQMRVKIKKPMTDKAVELAMKELEKLSGGDADTAVAILEQSILNSWQGLFALRDRQQKVGGVNWDNV